MIFMALTFLAQLQNWMPFDASKPRDLYFPYSSHLSGHKKKARKNSIRLLVKFWNRLWNFKQFKLKSISGKSIWVGTVQHSLTSSDLANVCKKRGNNIGLDALDGWAGESCEIMGLMLASFTGNVDDQDNLAIVLVQGHFLSINILHLANTNKTPMPTTSFWLQAPTLQVSLHICKHLYLVCQLSHLPLADIKIDLEVVDTVTLHFLPSWLKRITSIVTPDFTESSNKFQTISPPSIITFCPFMFQREDSPGTWLWGQALLPPPPKRYRATGECLSHLQNMWMSSEKDIGCFSHEHFELCAACRTFFRCWPKAEFCSRLLWTGHSKRLTGV